MSGCNAKEDAKVKAKQITWEVKKKHTIIIDINCIYIDLPTNGCGHALDGASADSLGQAHDEVLSYSDFRISISSK